MGSGQAGPSPGVFEGAKPFARPRTQSDSNEPLTESPPDILGCPVQRAWLPSVAPSPKEISHSLWLPFSLPSSRPTAASHKSAGALGVTGAATSRAPSIIAGPPPPATCAPRGDRDPHRGCSGGPQPQAQPGMLIRAPQSSPVPQRGPQAAAAAGGRRTGAAGERSRQQIPAIAISWHPTPAPARCQPRDHRATLLSPSPCQPSLSLRASLGKQTPLKAFGD